MKLSIEIFDQVNFQLFPFELKGRRYSQHELDDSNSMNFGIEEPLDMLKELLYSKYGLIKHQMKNIIG